MCTTAAATERPARRQSFADLLTPVLQFEQGKHFGRLVAVRVSDESNTRRLAAGIDLDANGLCLAANTIPQPDREWVAPHCDSPPALQQ
jgi:hypothetical protein